MMRQDKRTQKYEYEIFESRNGNERQGDKQNPALKT